MEEEKESPFVGSSPAPQGPLPDADAVQEILEVCAKIEKERALHNDFPGDEVYLKTFEDTYLSCPLQVAFANIVSPK